MLKAGLPTDQLGPVTQREVAAWRWIKGYFRVVGVQVKDMYAKLQTNIIIDTNETSFAFQVQVDAKAGDPATEEEWNFCSEKVGSYHHSLSYHNKVKYN